MRSLFKFFYFFDKFIILILSIQFEIETVTLFDSANKESIFREIESLVVRKQFDINLLYNNDVLLDQFKCEDIFPATLQASSDSANSIPIGNS